MVKNAELTEGIVGAEGPEDPPGPAGGGRGEAVGGVVGVVVGGGVAVAQVCSNSQDTEAEEAETCQHVGCLSVTVCLHLRSGFYSKIFPL